MIMKQINQFIITLLLLITLSEVSSKSRKKTILKPGKKSGNVKVKITKARIIEGHRASQKDYPFVASLIHQDVHLCGGSIITDTVILTAGHCCIDEDGLPFDVDELSVAVGSSRWQDTSHKFKVSKVIVHEDFESESLLNDIALWVIKHRLSKYDNVRIVRLARLPVHEDLKKVHATVLGWGFTSQQGLLVNQASDDLMFVNIYSMTLEECGRQHEDLNEGQICFTSPDRRGSCFGDSGGPLVVGKRPKFVQIGLVSFGEDCNNTYPEVYTRISTYYTWIKKKVEKVKISRKKKLKKHKNK